MIESRTGTSCLRAKRKRHAAPHRRHHCIAISATLACLASHASRADTTWTGAVDTNFNNPLNWSAGVPGPSDRAVFPATAPADSVLSGIQGSVQGLVFGPGSAASTVTVTAATAPAAGLAVGAQGIVNTGPGTASIVLATTATTLSLSGAQATIQGQVDLSATSYLSTIEFLNGAHAGSATLVLVAGSAQFQDTASAGAATLQLGTGSNVSFTQAASADHALITIAGGGAVFFEDNSNAAQSHIVVRDGVVGFTGSSSAGQASVTNLSTVAFTNLASAASAQIVNGGALVFRDSSSAGSSTITNQAGANLAFMGLASAASATIGNAASATLDASGMSAPRLSIGSLSGAGAVLLGATTLVEGGLGLDDTIAGTLSGAQGGLIKVGSGTLTLSGAATYGGATTVAAGALALEGSIQGNTFVDGGATLTGVGRSGGSVFLQPGATLWADQPGTGLKVGGALSLANGARFVTVLDGAAAAVTAVGGTLGVAGAALDVVAEGALSQYHAGSTYTIATAQGGLDGRLGGVSTNLLSLTPEVIYEPDALEIRLEPRRIHAPPGGAGAGTASGADGVPGLPALLEPLGPSALGSALAVLSGTAYQVQRESELVAADEFARELLERAQLPAAPGVSLDVVGSEARVKAQGETAGADVGTTGMWVGLTLARGPGWDVASAVRIERGRLDFTLADPATGRFDRTDLGVEARVRIGAAELSADLCGGAHHDIMNRSVSLPGLAADLASRSTGADATFVGRIDWPLDVGAARLAPYAEAGATSLHWGGFEEGGSALVELAGLARHATVPFDELGVAIASGATVPTRAGAPPFLRASLGWLHQAAGAAPPMEARFIGDESATTFPVAGAPLGHDFANAAVTAILPLRFGLQLELRARARTNDQFRELDGYAGVHLDW